MDMQPASAEQAMASAVSAPIGSGENGAAQAAPAPVAASEKPKTGMEAAFDRAQKKLGIKIDADGAIKSRQNGVANGNGRSEAISEPVEAEIDHQAPADASGQKPAQDAPKPLQAPDRWTQADKDVFAKQPREVQEAWLAQSRNWDAGYRKKFDELAEARKFHEEVGQRMSPELRNLMQQRGLSPSQVVSSLIKAHQDLMNNPVGFLQGVMASRGIDPRVFLQAQGPNGQAQPNAAQLVAPIVQPLAERLQILERERAEMLHQERSRHEQAIADTLTQVMSDTDATGASKYPHLERVADQMAAILQSDVDGSRFGGMDHRQRLDAAYQIAVLMIPELRDELISSEATKRASAMESSRNSAALLAAATVKPTSPTQAVAAPKKGFEGAWERAQKRLGTSYR